MKAFKAGFENIIIERHAVRLKLVEFSFGLEKKSNIIRINTSGAFQKDEQNCHTSEPRSLF